MKKVGERAWLLEWDDAEEETANARARAARRRLEESAPLGLVDAVPAARSLLVTGDESFDAAALEDLQDAAPEASAGREHLVVVTPDGLDLPDVLSTCGLREADLWGTFTRIPFVVGFLGFSPGFPYLYGLPPELRLARRPSPRVAVPTGSVALAAGYAGIYPSAMPGGWNLIGTTRFVLFDADATPPATLSPGDTVRFQLA